MERNRQSIDKKCTSPDKLSNWAFIAVFLHSSHLVTNAHKHFYECDECYKDLCTFMGEPRVALSYVSRELKLLMKVLKNENYDLSLQEFQIFEKASHYSGPNSVDEICKLREQFSPGYISLVTKLCEKFSAVKNFFQD